jgi:hypothetical protein
MQDTLAVIAQQPVAVVALLVFYKTVALVVGFGFAYLGYRMFIGGVYIPAET